MSVAYTVASLAEHWACSRDVIYKLIRDKQIKAFRIGTDLRISAEEVARYENGD